VERPWRALVLLAGLLGCERAEPKVKAAPPRVHEAQARARTPAEAYTAKPPANRFAYIPPQCYVKTKDERGDAANPCYVCHTTAQAPNPVDDAHLQLRRQLPEAARVNPWTNLLEPAIGRTAALGDDELLRYVRASNYLRDGKLVLAEALAALPEAWDGEADSRWDGFVPDAYFTFDREGYDLRPDGTRSGWRAFAYAPLPGLYTPGNGSASEVLMRLAPALRQADDGALDAEVEAINFAIVEALITRQSVRIEVDERAHGVDLDLDGSLGMAHLIKLEPRANGSTRLRYVGKARELPIAIGLFPPDTEFLHGLRYLDVREHEVVRAPRMKELRYARKTRWLSYDALGQRRAGTGARELAWCHDRGIDNGQGWLLQGFIEDAHGELRPQTHEETLSCAGCHGAVGANTDSTFALARKLAAPSGGWFHASQRGFEGLREPRRADGQYEYELYLQQNRAGDSLRDDDELLARFFDGTKPLPAALAALHADLASLLVPSPPRALALDHAYRAVVMEQSFVRGREAVLKPNPRVYRRAPADKPTGVARAVLGQLRR
jgi:hypothetical protein